MADFSHIQQKLDRLERYIKNDMPRTIGKEAVNFFTENFHKGGFVDQSLQKWKPSKRTNPSSPWYGFQHPAYSKPPSNHPRRKNTTRPYKARKSNPMTNYSPAATKRKTLIGPTGELANSIQYKIVPGKVIVFSDKEYSQIHNRGGKIKVFAKKTAVVPQRKFIGNSRALTRKLNKIIKRDISKII